MPSISVRAARPLPRSYVDHGNPTSGPRVVNPYARSWPNTSLTRTHFARSWGEEGTAWGPGIANMVKIWFDREDSWESLLDNVHQQAGMAWFQASGAFINTGECRPRVPLLVARQRHWV